MDSNNNLSKIVELSPGFLFIPSTTNTGIVVDEKAEVSEVYIIDSGNSELSGEFILDILKDYFKNKPYKIKAIINTHSHADHCGGNSFIQKKTNCQIWCMEKERGSIENPILQTVIIWAGMTPKELQGLYFFPEATSPNKLIHDGERLELSGNRSITFVDLPGHYFQTAGVLCEDANNDRFLFAADSIFERKEIARYSIPYMLNPDVFITSLDKMCNIENVKVCIPGHGNIINGTLYETAELDKLAILETELSIKKILEKESLSTEDLVKRILDVNGIQANLTQYCLISSTIKSFLSCMHNRKLLNFSIIENKIVWEINKKTSSL